MALPAEFDTVTLTGRYVELDGDPVQGYLTFKASPTILKAAASKAIIIPVVLEAPLDAEGIFSIALPATNDPDINPGEWTYEVTEGFGPRRIYSIAVTLENGPTQNLFDLAPLPTANGTFYLQGERGPTGPSPHVVSGPPASTLGAVDDIAIDPTAGKVYRRTLSGWDAGTSIVGPAGRSVSSVTAITGGWRVTYSDATTADISFSAVAGITGAAVGTTDTQTLSNKTLAAPTVTGQLSGVDATFSGNVGITGDLTVDDTTGDLATFNKVTLNSAPTVANDAVRKDYADALGSGTTAPNTIMRRDAAQWTEIKGIYGLEFVQPGWSNDSAANKGYIDQLVGLVGPSWLAGTAYTPIFADAYREIDCANTADTTITIPTNATVAYPVGTVLKLVQWTATGRVTVVGASGVTVNAPEGYQASSSGQMTTIYARKRDTDHWILSGQLRPDTPTAAHHLTRKDYVDALGTHDNIGSTVMRRTAGGNVAISTPTATSHAATKGYVDGQFSDTGWLDLSVASGWSTTHSKYRVKNGIFYYIAYVTRASWSTSQLLATISTAAYRPTIKAYIFGTWAKDMYDIAVETTGEIQVAQAGAGGLVISGSWPIG